MTTDASNAASLRKNRIAILSVGTEVTSGQILNRNAQWLSEKCSDLGGHVILHEVVEDDRVAIFEALTHCAERAHHVFISGGLGPTTDDFTREVIAQWLQKPLAFNSDTWEKIRLRLEKFGIPVAESNRQQCFFPEDSQIFRNNEGTADAFCANVQKSFGLVQLYALPGPPNEIRAIWKDGMQEHLAANFSQIERVRLHTWQCLGKSESELGEITERVFQGSGLQIGYRAHRPFVEIKVWIPESRLKESAVWISNLEKQIAPWFATRNGEDLALRFLREADRATSIEIFDRGTQGRLAQRIGSSAIVSKSDAVAEKLTILSEWGAPTSPLEWVDHLLNQSEEDRDDDQLRLCICGFNEEGIGAIGMAEGAVIRSEEIRCPWKISHSSLERISSFTAEKALLTWSDWLRKTVQ